MKTNMIFALICVSLLSACAEPDKDKQSAIEKAGHEAGQAAAKELHEPIDKAKELQDEMNNRAEELDQQVDEQP